MTILVLIAQLYLGFYFLSNAYAHFAQRAALAQWGQMRGTPSPSITVPLTGLMHLGAGLSLLLGYQTVYGAWLGILFLVLAAFLVHHPWTDQGMERATQMAHFQKNLALAAALLLVTFLPSAVWTIHIRP